MRYTVSAKITGIGWVTAASMGCGKDHESFTMPYEQLPKITAAAVFDESYPHFRRLDEYSRLGLAAIAFALKDAGLVEWTERRNIGIMASTVYGCLGTDVDYYDTVMPQKGLSASPTLFSYTLPNSFLGEASIRFGLTGTSFVITEQHPSGLISLQMALDLITFSGPEKILCGVCDLGCPPLFSERSNLPVPPGALFFIIEKLPPKGSLLYGKLDLNKKGRVLFNGSEVKDLTTLAQKCLAESH